jgi:hypothetical protein
MDADALAESAAPLVDAPPCAAHMLWLAYAGRGFRLVASYRGHPVWGWLAEIAQTDPDGNDLPPNDAEWQFEQASPTGLRTPQECLAAAVRTVTDVIIERADHEDGEA